VITKALGPKELGGHPQYNRGLAEAGIIDAFITKNGRIFYPLHAQQQKREYEKKKRAINKPRANAQEPSPAG
jgi:hypothetical protein